MGEPETITNLVALIRRQQAALLEEGSLADRADELVAVVHPDGRVSLRLLPPARLMVHPALEKSVALDPVYEKRPRPWLDEIGEAQ